MNERERWIVYPLLFFALGAALRDKFLQQVSTKDVQCNQLVAKQIVCDEISVRDPAQPNRVVAKLTSGTPAGAQGKNADRFGVLLLIDSEGKELFHVTNNQLQVQRIGCSEIYGNAISVVDPENPQRQLATLTSATAKLPDGSSRRIGSLLLTDSTGAEIFGLVNDAMRMRSVVCQSLAIFDPASRGEVLAALGAGLLPGSDGDPPRRVGLLELNGQRFAGVQGEAVEAPLAPPTEPADPEASDADRAGKADGGAQETDSSEAEPESDGEEADTPDDEA